MGGGEKKEKRGGAWTVMDNKMRGRNGRRKMETKTQNQGARLPELMRTGGQRRGRRGNGTAAFRNLGEKFNT